MSVLVVGAGFAGLAAAWELSRRGRRALLGWRGEGASALYSGALDWGEWQDGATGGELSEGVLSFLEALGAWAPPATVTQRVASTAGVVRPARTRDRAVLDLEPLRGRRIAVVDFDRPSFDARSLARSWATSAWARDGGARFEVLRVEAPDVERARRLSDLDLAVCFDDPGWQAALADTLRGSDRDALLFGPWLGLEPGSAARLQQRAGIPLGETLSDPGGAAGVRFEAARDGWLATAGIETWRGSVRRVERGARGVVAWGHPGAVEPEAPAGSAPPEPVGEVFSAVILAVGGVLGGGIRFLAGGPGPLGRTLSLSLECSASLRLGGREVALQSGAQGVDLQRLGLDALHEVGLRVDAAQRAEPPDLFAAGDVVAARPRTVIEAVHAGIEAGRAAAALC